MGLRSTVGVVDMNPWGEGEGLLGRLRGGSVAVLPGLGLRGDLVHSGADGRRGRVLVAVVAFASLRPITALDEGVELLFLPARAALELGAPAALRGSLPTARAAEDGEAEERVRRILVGLGVLSEGEEDKGPDFSPLPPQEVGS